MGYTAHGVPVPRLDTLQPKKLLDRPQATFLSIVIHTQFRKPARNGNSAEELLVCERVRHPVVAAAVAGISWGIRRRRGRDVTTSFARRSGETSAKTPATPNRSDLEAWVGAEHGQRECQGSLVSMHTSKNVTVRIEYLVTKRMKMRMRTVVTRTEQEITRSEQGDLTLVFGSDPSTQVFTDLHRFDLDNII